MPYRVRDVPARATPHGVAGLVVGEEAVFSRVEAAVLNRPGKAHYHLNGTEHLVVLSGRGIVRFIDQDIPLRPGRVVVIDSETPHQLLPAPRSMLRLVLITVPSPTGLDSFSTRLRA